MISQILSAEIKQGKDSAGGGVVSCMGQTAWTKSGSEQGGRWGELEQVHTSEDKNLEL